MYVLLWSVYTARFADGGCECESAMIMLESTSVVETFDKEHITVEYVRIISYHHQNFKDMVKSWHEVKGKEDCSKELAQLVKSYNEAISQYEESIKEVSFVAKESRKFVTGNGIGWL